ncbi:aldehyde dehydrogenase (NADP(+)) [Octadecabacter ascidiaceicola]|uniref:Alpha-ketoglutaric semialdehyde dehydrogenase n=1 Tax=Octadecabacter ascidiaceicola TaxID=1655543 RepID=A0A238K4E6_9RHOB|nr:aldehyde dehydrogenase (NADP(+)) [Octadecabacter ascidiaceicola]SMX36816.1 Alpha-ketoglutaric semialdehyde dehydrogenase [Octadecabacter ascidiaceicola]
MNFTPHGKHLIAGNWTSGDAIFSSSPAHGPSHDYAVGRVEDVDAAVQAAEDAFWDYGYSSREVRAEFLNTIADEIEARAAAITEIGTQETGLPEARLQGERGRTTGQLRLFASHILAGDYLDRRHDGALPDRQPLPRPDLKMVQRPIGPVAVFGASNFPLAFSTAGGDTAAALAAGCPVVVKGHSAHPGTGEIIAEAIAAAIRKCNLQPGVFSMIQGGNRAVGAALVQHPLIKAVGFTGSLAGGRALFDLCASRPEPIPFFGELGSVNPMFILNNALHARGEAIGKGWAASLSMGAGQFCTNPGIAVVCAGEAGEAFATAACQALGDVTAQTMLTDGIASAYRDGQRQIAETSGVQELLVSMCDQRDATPYLYRTTAKNWLNNHALAEEVFGPLGLIVEAENEAEMRKIALSLQGQLTCTLHMDDSDLPAAAALMPIFERKAGRILANGFPTGVEVSDTMVHGGPYPASTNFGATSVGTLSIRRFLRPVCYQNLPAELVPERQA